MLFTAIPPLVYRKGMSLAYVTFSSDLALAEQSVRAFHEAAIEYEHLLPGHGRPIIGGARHAVVDFLERRLATNTFAHHEARRSVQAHQGGGRARDGRPAKGK